MIALLDTNVIVKFLTGDKNLKFQGVFKFFQDIEKGTLNVELKLIVLFQTVFVLKSFYKVPKTNIVQVINGLLQLKGLHIKEKRIVQKTMEIWAGNNIKIVDAYSVAHMEKDPENILYSYDTDFEKFNIYRIEP